MQTALNILNLLSGAIVWTGLISNWNLYGFLSTKVPNKKSKSWNVYQTVLPVMWLSWVVMGTTYMLIRRTPLSYITMLADIALGAYWWYLWKRDSDGRWKKRAQKATGVIRERAGKLVVEPVPSTVKG